MEINELLEALEKAQQEVKNACLTNYCALR